jgi:hypothetical protein
MSPDIIGKMSTDEPKRDIRSTIRKLTDQKPSS